MKQSVIVSRHCRFFNLTFSKHALNNSIEFIKRF